MKKNLLKSIITILFVLLVGAKLTAQPVPSAEENIPFIVTFGADARTSYGDDDFCQIFFFLIPASHTDPIYIRVFDPDTGGELDEAIGNFNTTLNFSVYGGEGCWSNEDAQGTSPKGNYRSGIQLASRSFGNEPEWDQKYYTFGPFNPFEGEYVKKFDGRIFKIITQGLSGNDGNLYRYFLSTHPDKNIPVEGGNAFTYKYTLRLHDKQSEVSQIYSFVDDATISVEISNFDWDNDGDIRIISVAKNGVRSKVSGDDVWMVSKFPIIEEERNTSLEIQFVKNQDLSVVNNNVVVIVRNQYGDILPFFVIPIGGRPVYTPRIRMEGI